MDSNEKNLKYISAFLSFFLLLCSAASFVAFFFTFEIGYIAMSAVLFAFCWLFNEVRKDFED